MFQDHTEKEVFKIQAGAGGANKVEKESFESSEHRIFQNSVSHVTFENIVRQEPLEDYIKRGH